MDRILWKFSLKLQNQCSLRPTPTKFSYKIKKKTKRPRCQLNAWNYEISSWYRKISRVIYTNLCTPYNKYVTYSACDSDATSNTYACTKQSRRSHWRDGTCSCEFWNIDNSQTFPLSFNVSLNCVYMHSDTSRCAFSMYVCFLGLYIYM